MSDRSQARSVGQPLAQSKRFRQYAGAVLVTLTATVLRLLLQPFIGFDFPFITYFAAVFLSAWWFEFKPTLLTVLLSAFLTNLLFFPPSGADDKVLGLSAIGLALFVGIGVGTACFRGTYSAPWALTESDSDRFTAEIRRAMSGRQVGA